MDLILFGFSQLWISRQGLDFICRQLISEVCLDWVQPVSDTHHLFPPPCVYMYYKYISVNISRSWEYKEHDDFDKYELRSCSPKFDCLIVRSTAQLKPMSHGNHGTLTSSLASQVIVIMIVNIIVIIIIYDFSG